MKSKVKNKQIKKTVVLALALAICMFVSVFGAFGGASDVKADETEPFYYIEIETPVWWGGYGVTFDEKGEATMKWGSYPKNMEDITDWTPYQNVMNAADRDKYYMDGYVLKGFGTNKLEVKWGANESIKVKKSDFVKDEDGDYVLHLYGVYNWHEEWIDGMWFEADGSQIYKSKASWKGSGTSFWFETESGWYPYSAWVMIDHDWFYFKDDGYCACNEWVQIDGSWYHFDENGYYDFDCWVDGYYIGKDGIQTYASVGGWKSDSTGWWFEDESGWYAKKELVWIDGESYYFKENGYMACNEKLVITDEYEGVTYKYEYTFDSNGKVTEVVSVE